MSSAETDPRRPAQGGHEQKPTRRNLVQIRHEQQRRLRYYGKGT